MTEPAALFDVRRDLINGPRVVASIAAQRGMRSALDHEGDQGRAVARQRVLHVASLGEEFSIDTVRAEEFVNTVSAGTWGAVFSTLAREGRIRRVGVTTSKRPESHGRLVRVWREATAHVDETG